MTAISHFMNLQFSDEVAGSARRGEPIVALESTVISHGLPYPQNLETALSCEALVREGGAAPATIAILDGEFCVGLDRIQLERLATAGNILKASRRDLPLAAARKLTCATTVATTSFIAHRAGVRVFATGGIGGVHRGQLPDVSADLPELARTPIVVICSGAKAVLDLPATREWLETQGVTVLGWRCDEFPAFYSRSSGLAVDQRVESAADVAAIADARDQLQLAGAVLVTVPPPDEYAMKRDGLDSIIEAALSEATKRGVTGKEVTPFLLGEMSALSGGRTLAANIALLKNNARIAAEIAVAMCR